MIWLMENNPNSGLAKLISGVMRDKGLSTTDVERRSGGKIKQSYVTKLKNGQLSNLSAAKISALADGLGIPVEEIFRAMKGNKNAGGEFEQKLLYAASEAKNWSKSDQEEFIKTVNRVVAGIRAEKKE